MSPTQRTLAALKAKGMRCGIVERFNRFGGPHGIRQDLFGIIDIIAIHPDRGVVGIQSTGQDFAGHYRKLTQDEAESTAAWLSTPGASLELWGWRKLKAQRGGKRMKWEPRVLQITPEMIHNPLAA